MKDSWVTCTDLCYSAIVFNGIRALIFICNKKVIVPNTAVLICCWLFIPAFFCGKWKELGI